jgi:large subunit ribosomal protein L1
MSKKGKRYAEAAAKYDKERQYSIDEAITLLKSIAFAKFDETVEAVFRLGIDARKADQLVRGTVGLPNGIGKDVRVAVFAQGEKITEAESAGADVVGGKELTDSIAGGGELNFDVAIATPDMMAEVGKLGRVLGPRGLMPNPKTGTVTMDVGQAVEEFKAGKIEYRNDRHGNVQAPIGKISFDVEKLTENMLALASEINRAKPAGAKGRYIRNVAITSTMGPGIRVSPSEVEAL